MKKWSVNLKMLGAERWTATLHIAGQIPTRKNICMIYITPDLAVCVCEERYRSNF